MAGRPRTAPAKKKQPAAKETSESIADQTAAFLSAGNKIDYIDSGISGQSVLRGPKHISLGNNDRAK
jgi:hypothetical protein